MVSPSPRINKDSPEPRDEHVGPCGLGLVKLRSRTAEAERAHDLAGHPRARLPHLSPPRLLPSSSCYSIQALNLEKDLKESG